MECIAIGSMIWENKAAHFMEARKEGAWEKDRETGKEETEKEEERRRWGEGEREHMRTIYTHILQNITNCISTNSQ